MLQNFIKENKTKLIKNKFLINQIFRGHLEAKNLRIF